MECIGVDGANCSNGVHDNHHHGALLTREENYGAWDSDSSLQCGQPQKRDLPLVEGSPAHAKQSDDAIALELKGERFAVDLSADDGTCFWGFEGDNPVVPGQWSDHATLSGEHGSKKCEIVEAEGDESKTKSGVQECCIEEASILDKINLEEKKRPSWRKMEKKVQASVQVPLPVPFNRTDLKWDTKMNQGNGKWRETKKATIPWDRLEDFLEGEMSARQYPYTFVEESRQCMTKDARKQVRAESAVQEISYCCQYGPQDYSQHYKVEVQKVFAHTLTQRKNSTNQRNALQRAQKIVDKAAKESAAKPRAKKKSKNEPKLDLNDEAIDEDAEEQARVKEAQETLLQAQALIDSHVKPRRKTRVSKVQAGMSMKRGCHCNFVAKQLLVDESLCTIHFHCMNHTNR